MALDREGRGVVVGAHADPGLVGGQVVDAVRARAAERSGIRKSCMRTSSGSPVGRSSLPPLRNGPTSSFFFVSTLITGSPRESCSWTALVDVAELGVAVGVARALERLAVGLQAVAHLLEQLGHGLVADRVAQAAELVGEVADAPGRPAQRGLGVAPGAGLDERLEVGAQRRVALLDGWPSGPRPADPAATEGLARRGHRRCRAGPSCARDRSPGPPPPRRPDRSRWLRPRPPAVGPARRAAGRAPGTAPRWPPHRSPTDHSVSVITYDSGHGRHPLRAPANRAS